MGEMIEISDRTRTDLFTAVRVDLSNPGENSFAVTLVARHGERLEASGRLLTTWSPAMRALLALNTFEPDIFVFLPDFDSGTIGKVLELLEMRWEEEEEVVITQEMVNLLNCFCTDPGKMEPLSSCGEVCCDLCDERISNVRKHMENEHGDLVLSSTEMQSFCRPVVKAEYEGSEGNGDQSMLVNLEWQDIKIEVEETAIEDLEIGDAGESFEKMAQQQNSKDKSQGKSSRCPRCALSFKNRPTLKRHIGAVHFEAELMAKADWMFEGEKCSQCGKMCRKKFEKKMHMLHHHTKVGSDISQEIEKVLKQPSSKCPISKLQRGATSKSREVKAGENNGRKGSKSEADTIQEHLLEMQSEDDDEDGISEKGAKNNVK